MAKTLEHIGMIMDGNRRWAKERGLPSFEGHRAGYAKVREVLGWCSERGIKVLTLYAFSTENWKRSQDEVQYLMDLFQMLFSKDVRELHKNNIRVRIIGHKKGLSKKLQEAIEKAEKLTENNSGSILNLAINYGGRQELVDAFNKLKNEKGDITPEMIGNNLYTYGLPDPDLIIRTSGEQRLSGFLLWQGAYSELLFIEKNWPDLSKDDFDNACREFGERQRRYGA
jgi:undecaprenyl diphosphate synthase